MKTVTVYTDGACSGNPDVYKRQQGEVARRSRDGGDEKVYVLPHLHGRALCKPATF